MESRSFAIGVDIGGSHISCGAVDLEKGQLWEHTLTRVSVRHDASAETIFRQWSGALEYTFSLTEGHFLKGIGFAMPGPFDYRNGISHMVHKFINLNGLHIADSLFGYLPDAMKKPIRFLNDAACFAIGEAWMGEGKGADRVVVITLGTGFGSAFVEHGVPVVKRPDVPAEGCLWHTPFKGKTAEEWLSTRWFVETWHERTGETVDGVKTLMERAGVAGIARDLFAEYGQNVAGCLGPWLKSFGADVLVIGGNISHALHLFEVPLKAGLETYGVSSRIAISRLYEKAAILGSARLLAAGFWEKAGATLPNL